VTNGWIAIFGENSAASLHCQSSLVKKLLRNQSVQDSKSFSVALKKKIYIRAGLPDISWYNICTKTGKKCTEAPKVYQMTIKYNKWPENVTNGRKM
jgi:hypothetical protein